MNVKQESLEYNWFDDLTDEQQLLVYKAIEQANNGEGISHEEAISRLGL